MTDKSTDGTERKPFKFTDDPPTWVDRHSDHSNRAVYTCEDCGAKHKGFKPENCWKCEGDDLNWSYSYGYRRFA